MKKYLLFCIAFILVVSLQAQRRYNHSRVKVDKQIEINNSAVDEKLDATAPVNKIENTVVPVSISSNVEYSAVQLAPIKRKKTLTFIDQDVKEDVSARNFIVQILETHRKLDEIKDVKKPMLRTWLWVFISACILLLIGITFLIIGYTLINKGKYGTSYIVIGYISASLGFLGGIIVLILGLSGRI